MKRLIALALPLLLAGCFGQTTVKLYEKPEFTPPPILPAQQLGAEWTVVTKDNINALIKEAEVTGQPFVLFAVTPTGYSNIIVDISELRRYIEQQNAAILAYREYYKPSGDAKSDEKKNSEDRPWWKIW